MKRFVQVCCVLAVAGLSLIAWSAAGDAEPVELPTPGVNVYSDPDHLPIRGVRDVVTCTFFNGCDPFNFGFGPFGYSHIEFAVEPGDFIYSAGAGQVESLYSSNSGACDATSYYVGDLCDPAIYETFVVVDHGDEVRSLYVGFDFIQVSVGQWVGPNTVLGTADSESQILHYVDLSIGADFLNGNPLLGCSEGQQVAYPEDFGQPTWDHVEYGSDVVNENLDCFQSPPGSGYTSGASADVDVSLALIVDASGSMLENDPDDRRLDAGAVSLNVALDTDEIGLVSFAGSVRELSGPVPVGTNGDALRAHIEQIQSFGSTNLAGAVIAGCRVLSEATGQIRAAILLTDGQPTVGGYRMEQDCARPDWPIFTIGLGDGVDDELLRRIATDTGGTYTKLSEATNLTCVFIQIRATLAGTATSECEATGTIAQNETLVQTEKILAPLQQVTFANTWGGSDIEMTLTSPSGRTIDRNSTEADVEVTVSPTSETISIDRPEEGEWTVSLFGADIPDEGEEFVYSTVQLPLVASDTDGDGIDDAVDNCTDEPNKDQTDTDRDGIGDACEEDTEPDEDPGEDPGQDDPVQLIVRLRGETGDERFEVRHKGKAVGNGRASEQWQSYEVMLPPGSTAGQVQVAFTNDAYRKPYDRNLHVDYIELNGDRFESEDPATLGTGTWSRSAPCEPGYAMSETIHCNGYFQYTDDAVSEEPTPTKLVVRLRGETGDERFEVRHEGRVVLAARASTDWEIHEIMLGADAELSDVQVAFTNDAYRKPYDRNLHVDYVEFEGKRYESEDPGTLGTGTWSRSAPCEPGYAMSETIHCDGYFQYAGARP